jgi:hypothetical protein
MITPAGKECQYFYGDYHRGRTLEECRLLEAATASQRWTRDLCSICPVPDILRANACTDLVLEGSVERPFPFVRRKVKIKAYCTRTMRDVAEPQIGCGECHPLPAVFSEIKLFSEDKASTDDKSPDQDKPSNEDNTPAGENSDVDPPG